MGFRNTRALLYDTPTQGGTLTFQVNDTDNPEAAKLTLNNSSGLKIITESGGYFQIQETTE